MLGATWCRSATTFTVTGPCRRARSRDGPSPSERILKWVLQAGYTGTFDIRVGRARGSMPRAGSRPFAGRRPTWAQCCNHWAPESTTSPPLGPWPVTRSHSMAFGDCPDDEALRAAWRVFCERLQQERKRLRMAAAPAGCHLYLLARPAASARRIPSHAARKASSSGQSPKAIEWLLVTGKSQGRTRCALRRPVIATLRPGWPPPGERRDPALGMRSAGRPNSMSKVPV